MTSLTDLTRIGLRWQPAGRAGFTGPLLALADDCDLEMIARQTGVGNILFNSLDMAQYDTVYAMIVIIGALGYTIDLAFEGVRSRLVGWAAPAHDIVAGTT